MSQPSTANSPSRRAIRTPSVRHLAVFLALVGITTVLTTCSPPLPVLEEIRASGTLRMATVNSATTYYLAAAGPAGFEYDLGQHWAKVLDTDLEVVLVTNREEAIQAVQSGRAHFAAGLAETPSRKERVRFTQPYLEVTKQVVWRSGTKKPKKYGDLDGKLTLPAHIDSVEWLARNHPDIEFAVDEDANTEELLVRVANKEIDYTIADSTLVKLNQRYYPKLRVAFDLGDPSQLGWIFPVNRDPGLYNKAVAFLDEMKQSKAMQTIVDRHFGHIDRVGFVGGKSFARQVEERLPKWRKDFQKAGKSLGMDWRLLAAVGYQESHWNPAAVSPTGVRGLMMLTNATAREMNVNRLDPKQSISGGARYLKMLKARMPNMTGGLSEPDHTWLALAAYNIGMGHIMDARRLVQSASGNPDRWIEVRAALPKLTQERYFTKTRYGYARGHEAVGYVGNIRAYYDILLWMTSDREMEIPETLTEDNPETPPEKAEEKALGIDIPVL